jgi:hypothetical protein
MTEPNSPQGDGGTDVAALSAGVVAVSVSLFVAPGAYSSINLVVSATLLAIIWGYVWPRQRRLLQTLGVAAAIGLAAVPAIGFFDEAARSRDPLSYLLASYTWDCAGDADPCNQNDEPQSRVQEKDITLGWLSVLLITFVTDRIRQRSTPV